MPLYVYTDKCKEESHIRKDSNIQYNVGMWLMVVGMSKLTNANIVEFKSRVEFWGRLHRYSVSEIEEFYKIGEDAIGVVTNVSDEKTKSWVKRIAEGAFSEISYFHKRRESN